MGVQIVVKRWLALVGFMTLIFFTISSYGLTKGIYITQSTLENTTKIKYLISMANRYNLDTFIIDYQRSSSAYRRNIQLIHANNIRYVARIVIFPGGGTQDQINSKSYLEGKSRLIADAINMGAQEIQLDYIRYRVSNVQSTNNAYKIDDVIKWFRNKIAGRAKLQIDVFGETSFKPSKAIGQDVKVFSNSVDAINPMVYPSHYEPFRFYATRPYFIINKSLTSMKEQFNNKPPFKIHAFIEVYNYRYPMSNSEKQKYIYAQIKAVEDSGVDGWYVWSPTNHYQNLFQVLENNRVQ